MNRIITFPLLLSTPSFLSLNEEIWHCDNIFLNSQIHLAKSVAKLHIKQVVCVCKCVCLVRIGLLQPQIYHLCRLTQWRMDENWKMLSSGEGLWAGISVWFVEYEDCTGREECQAGAHKKIHSICWSVKLPVTFYFLIN